MGIGIDLGNCDSCGICVEICPEDILEVIEGKNGVRAALPEECWYCGACEMDCPQDAIRISYPAHMRPGILKGAAK